MSKVDVYQKVTDRIVEGLQSKGLQWFRPWSGGNGQMSPINNATGKTYKGLNTLFLCIEQMEKEYEHNEWLTYKQAEASGGQVRKGESGTWIVFWNISFLDPTSSPVKYYKKMSDVPPSIRPSIRKVFSPRSWNVFNIGQCDDIEPRRKPVAPVEGVGEFTPIEKAEKVYNEQYPKDNRPTLAHGGERAFYAPARHHVQMPSQETFVTNDDYYKTLFHELVHSTGHESILKRLDKVAAFGSEAYSKEELVAEIGCQFLVGLTGIQPKDDEQNSQAYINGWVKELNDKPKMALSAANKAMKAVDYIINEEEES
tara:strand:+ start:126 stop:1061 length:936 start_codon:yes stop_codon:yes gene_type:complete